MRMQFKTSATVFQRRYIPGNHGRSGMTMIETALAMIIVGLAVVAIVKLISSVTQQNFYAQKTTTALTLANNVREYMNGLPYNDPATGTHLGVPTGTPLSQFNDVEDFAGYLPNPAGYFANPPIDAYGQNLSNMANWRQEVYVTHVNPNNFALTDSLATDSACNLDRVQVVVSYNSAGTWVQIASIEWLKSKL